MYKSSIFAICDSRCHVPLLLLLIAIVLLSVRADDTPNAKYMMTKTYLGPQGEALEGSVPLYSAKHGLVYIGTAAGSLVAVRESDGQRMFHYSVTGASASNAIRCRPALAVDAAEGFPDTVLFTALDGRLHAINANNGENVWTFEPGFPLYQVYSGPAIESFTGESIELMKAGGYPTDKHSLLDRFVGTKIAVFGGTSDFGIYAVNVSTGKLVWKRVIDQAKFRASPAFYCHVSALCRVVIGSTNDNLYVLDAFTGEIVKFHNLGGDIVASASILASQAVVPTGRNIFAVRITGQFDAVRVHGLDAVDAKILAPVLIHTNTGIVGDTLGKVHVLNLDTGALICRSSMGSRIAQQALMLTDTVACVSSVASQLACFDVQNCDVRTALIVGGTSSIPGGPLTSAVVLGNGNQIAVASNDQHLYTINIAQAIEDKVMDFFPKKDETASTSASNKGAIIGAIIGATVGVVAMFLLMIAFLAVARRRRREEQPDAVQQPARQEEQPRGEVGVLELPPVAPEDGGGEGRIYSEIEMQPPQHLAGISSVPLQEPGDSPVEQAAHIEWRNSLTQSYNDRSITVEFPWAYMLRLTRSFTEPLILHNPPGDGDSGRQKKELFLGSEFVNGQLRQFVVKVISVVVDEESGGRLPIEVKRFDDLVHPNVMSVLGWSCEASGQRHHHNRSQPAGQMFRQRYALIMPFYPLGSLDTVLEDPHRAKHFSGYHRMLVILDVVRGLRQLHGNGVLHRDVKSANIVLGDDGSGILTDFDVSVESAYNTATGQVTTVGFSTNRRVFGTPGYICGDYARMRCGYGPPQEVFSLGVVMADLLTGKIANAATVDHTDYDTEEGWHFDERLGNNTHCSSSLASSSFLGAERRLVALCMRCMASRFRDRPTIDEVQKELRSIIADTQQSPQHRELSEGELPIESRSSSSALTMNRRAPTDLIEGKDAQLSAECVICFVDCSESSGGVECSAPVRHFLCSECINNRVGAYLENGSHDLVVLTCPIPGCQGNWYFDEYAPLLSAVNFIRWNTKSVEVARREGVELATNTLSRPNGAIVRKHCEAIRRLLRPTCPHCGLEFGSFSGCLTVSCSVPGRIGEPGASGCGKKFCGACLTPSPCPVRGHFHGFVSNDELHNLWKTWRRRKVLDYLRIQPDLPGGSELKHTVLQAARLDLTACGIFPL